VSAGGYVKVKKAVGQPVCSAYEHVACRLGFTLLSRMSGGR
jgi:hypothetical protein